MMRSLLDCVVHDAGQGRLPNLRIEDGCLSGPIVAVFKTRYAGSLLVKTIGLAR